MLVLSRMPDEIVDITFPSTIEELLSLAGKRIEVMPVEVRGDKTRLGFVAPPSVTIDRREVTLRKAKEQEAACSND